METGNSPRASCLRRDRTEKSLCSCAHMQVCHIWLRDQVAAGDSTWVASEKIMLQPEGVLQSKTCIGRHHLFRLGKAYRSLYRVWTHSRVGAFGAGRLAVPISQGLAASLGRGGAQVSSPPWASSQRGRGRALEMGDESRCQSLGRGCACSQSVLCTSGVFWEQQPDRSSLSSLSQFQHLEGSPASLRCPSSCRRPPWRTCFAHRPPSPATPPPPAV